MSFRSNPFSLRVTKNFTHIDLFVWHSPLGCMYQAELELWNTLFNFCWHLLGNSSKIYPLDHLMTAPALCAPALCTQLCIRDGENSCVFAVLPHAWISQYSCEGYSQSRPECAIWVANHLEICVPIAKRHGRTPFIICFKPHWEITWTPGKYVEVGFRTKIYMCVFVAFLSTVSERDYHEK